MCVGMDEEAMRLDAEECLKLLLMLIASTCILPPSQRTVQGFKVKRVQLMHIPSQGSIQGGQGRGKLSPKLSPQTFKFPPPLICIELLYISAWALPLLKLPFYTEILDRTLLA